MTRRLLLSTFLLTLLIFSGCANEKAILAITPSSANLKTGQSQQFSATINGTPVSNVNWFVNGIQGGNATVGTISPSGFYTAPAALPSPASIQISASLGQFGAVSTANVASVTLSSSGVGIVGIVIKGPLNASTVTAFAVNADGSNGASLGTATTDANGNFNITAAPTSGSVRLSATGGTYISELDGTTITNAGTLTAFLDSVGSAGISGLTINPLTTEVDALTVFYINNGLPTSGARVSGARTFATASGSSAHGAASTQIAGYYAIKTPTGVTLEQIIAKLKKADITGDPAGFNVGLIDGGILCLAKSLGVDPGALSVAFAKDISDGKFDGLFNKAPIVISGAKTLPTTFPTTDFLACVSSYLSSGTSPKAEGIVPSDASAITSAMSKGVQSSTLTPTSTGLSAGSSGALSSLTFTPAGSTTSKQILFAAARSNGVAVVDITDPSTVATGKAWPSVATTLGGEVGGVIPVTGAAHAQVFTFAYGSKKVALLNAEVLINGTPGNATDETNLIDFTATLPLKATSPVGFSGGSAFVAGGIPFGGGIWLATADGYSFFDLSTKALGKNYPIEGFLAENLGGDVPHNMLFAGNYSGVQIIDLNTSGKGSFNADAATFSQIQTDLGGGDTVDADSVDSTFQVGIMTPEDSSVADFLNLKTIVIPGGAPVSGITNPQTFAPGPNGLVKFSFSPTRTFSGSAVDSTSHAVLFMAGFSTDFGVGIVQDPKTSPWKGLSDAVTGNLRTAFSSYNIARDPHAVGVFLNGKTSTPFGYLLDGSTHRIIQIDMNAALALPRTTPGGQTTNDATFGTALKAITF